MPSLEGPMAEPAAIKVYGLLGTFRVGHSNFVVKYVSTFANPKAAGQLGGHKELLEELKPMRDRLDASKLQSLGSLLQRDLNDRRVAQDLIPYLLGAGASVGIGFFPAILAVIVPRGYLAEVANETSYPAPVVNANEPMRTDYDDCWSVTAFKMGGQTAPLGLLEIRRGSADIIVLDGQHRANAFRFLSGDFDPSKDIYQSFYDDLPKPEPLDADLPVTLIWFETQGAEAQINPQLISRRLFVDVNNTAKTVSLSRTILLNDRAATCLGTQEFYNRAAHDNGFSASRFSLLHGAFDGDSELAARRQHKFMLTTPEIIHDALLWGMFGSTAFDGLDYYKVGRLHQQQNTARFSTIFGEYDLMPKGTGDEEKQDSFFGPYFDVPEKAGEFRGAFSTAYLPVLWTLFNELSLLTSHYEAGAAIAEGINTGSSPMEMDVWDKVFCGGEGLYWSLDPNEVTSQRSKNYLTAIASIENRFADARAARFGQTTALTNSIYSSFLTKAFQIGYVGAVEYLAREVKEGDYLGAASELVARLNGYTSAQWVAVFTELKPLITPGLDPKFWPMYRNLLLRMYDGDRGSFYDAYNEQRLFKTPPDGVAYKANLEAAKRQLIAAYEDTAPPPEEVVQRARIALDKTNELLARCGLTASWFNSDIVFSHGQQWLKREIDAQPFSF